MEQHYDEINGQVWKEHRARKERKESLITELENLKITNSKFHGHDATQFLDAWGKMESKYLRFQRAKWNRDDFRTLKILGQGVFGTVSLVRNKNLEKFPNLFAMKTLNKTNIRQKNQVGHVIAERDFLSEANNNWIVKLQGSFQVRKFFKNILLKQC